MGPRSPQTASVTPPTALTIAGTDSGGGAGIAADLRSFAAQRVHGTFAVTVVTAQNTTSVRAARAMPPDLIGDQIDAVLDDFDVRATKTGLLFTVDAIETVAERASRLGALVVDPVLVRGTGERMLAIDVQHAYERLLLPAATVTTPNVAEAALLVGEPIDDLDAARAAAELLHRSGIPHVVVTGFLDGPRAIDLYANDAGVHELVESRVDTVNVHGTGCSFAATIAARLAHGDEPPDAIAEAKIYVAKAIHAAAKWRLGAGRGSIDHLA